MKKPYKELLTETIAENVGKILFGPGYKLDDLIEYPNGFRISHKNQFLHVEYESFRMYITYRSSSDAILMVSSDNSIMIYVYLNKAMGIKIQLPKGLKK